MAVTNEKIIILMKKIIWCRIGWATPQLYCEKKNLYCKAEIVLQEIGEKAVEIVLQYNFCIVIEAVRL